MSRQALTPALSNMRERGTKRKEPRWAISFLRALERTGQARSAAEDAGIDHTTAYARRRSHAQFAERWAEALAAHKARKTREEDGEIEALRLGSGQALKTAAAPDFVRDSSTVSPSRNGSTPHPAGGEELVASGSQVKRAGAGRWNARKEAIFFDELAATANAKRAASAAGVSYNAVHARRLKHPLFRAKWEAVVKVAKASIQLHLIEEANKTFDPDTLDTGDAAPRVTIDQAIKICQLNASKRQDEEELPDPFAEEAAAMSPDDVQEVRERILRKLRRMRERDRPDMIADGWSYDEEQDHMVPPGWKREDREDDDPSAAQPR